MTDRISDDRLAFLVAKWPGSGMALHQDTGSAMRELQQSRALISKLRELAERMRHYSATLPTTTFINDGKIEATDDWLSELDSILSAHGAQGEKA